MCLLNPSCMTPLTLLMFALDTMNSFMLWIAQLLKLHATIWPFNRRAGFIYPALLKWYRTRTFNLLAIGTSDTIVNGVDYDLTTIYRIDFESSGILDFVLLAIEKVAVHPFYFKNSFSSSDAFVRFTDIAVARRSFRRIEQ